MICEAFEDGAEEGPSNGTAGSRAGAQNLQELVQAAWGVYQTAGDEGDLVDSLVRIARLAVQPLSMWVTNKPPPSLSIHAHCALVASECCMR